MVHLHTRSCYSLLQSPFRLEDLVKKSKEYGYSSVCLTDNQTMFNTPKFLQLCKDNNIKGIVGLEVETNSKRYGTSHFVLLAKNNTGLQELYALSLKKSQHPISTYDVAVSTKNCICILEFVDKNDEIFSNNREILLRYLKKSCSNFYVGMCMMDMYPQENAEIKKVCQRLKIQTVALSRILYENEEDVESLRILKAIKEKTTIDSVSVEANRYFRTKEEMEALYDLEDLAQTDQIANDCDIDFYQLKNDLPDEEGDLKEICMSFLNKMFNNNIPEKEKEKYIEELEYELDVIQYCKFEDYFLIVHKFMKYMKEQNTYMGPGRGSATGSLVAYCLEITRIDPIQNDLNFDRFLTKKRTSMPDIDIDIPRDKMDLAIQYMKDTYGKDNTSFIVVLESLSAKEALENVARVMAVPQKKINNLVKVIKDWDDITLEKAYSNKYFREKLKDEELMNVYKACLKLEDIPLNSKRHPSGVIVAKNPIISVCPQMVVRKQSGNIDNRLLETQFDKNYIENLGLIKFDFLSSRVLMNIYEIKEKLKKDGIEIDPMNLDKNDKETFDLLCEGYNAGVFQMKQPDWSDLLKQVKPRDLIDLSKLLSLYRPGPVSNKDKYIEGRKKPADVKYAHPLLETILKETYGVLLYQEQLLDIAQKLGGFKSEDSDALRKAISKKKVDKVKAYRELFVQGAMQRNCSKEVANEIFNTMEHFGSYGYNKNHAYAYADIAYQTAYLKAHYPTYFYAEFIDDSDSIDKTRQLVIECDHRHIECLPVNIQHPTHEVKKNTIQLPISMIQGLGSYLVEQILDERNRAMFIDYIECVIRLQARKIQKDSIERLIQSGAFDCFDFNRATMLKNLDNVFGYGDKVIVEKGNHYEIDWTKADRPFIEKVDFNLKEYLEGVEQSFGTWYVLRMIRKQYFPFTTYLNSLDSQSQYVLVHTDYVREYHGRQSVFVEDETQKTRLSLKRPVRNTFYLYHKYCLMEVQNKVIVDYKIIDFDFNNHPVKALRQNQSIQDALNCEDGQQVEITGKVYHMYEYRRNDLKIMYISFEDETCFIEAFTKNYRWDIQINDICMIKGKVIVDYTGRKKILLFDMKKIG